MECSGFYVHFVSKLNFLWIFDSLNLSCFAKISQLNSALGFWFVACFEAPITHWCDNATVGHPSPGWWPHDGGNQLCSVQIKAGFTPVRWCKKICLYADISHVLHEKPQRAGSMIPLQVLQLHWAGSQLLILGSLEHGAWLTELGQEHHCPSIHHWCSIRLPGDCQDTS